MDLTGAAFAYTATIKLNELPPCKAQSSYPGVSDLAVNSRNFTSYVECINSVKGLMDDFVAEVNSGELKFVITTEVNPVLNTGQATRSKDWGPDELARLWIFNKVLEGQTTIQAVGQARIFKMGKAPAVKLN